MGTKDKKRKAFSIDISELTVRGKIIFPSTPSGKLTHGGKRYLITKAVELAANFSAGELMTVYENVTGDDAPPSWAKAGKAKVADKVFKALTETKMTFTKLTNKDDGSKPSVSARFKAMIKEDKSKEDTLEAIRTEFPDRTIPNSYFSWYKRAVEKENG